MDLAIGMLKLVALIFAALLVPMALMLATPFVLFWPRPEGTPWRQAVLSRYRKVVKSAWVVTEVFNAAIPD